MGSCGMYGGALSVGNEKREIENSERKIGNRDLGIAEGKLGIANWSSGSENWEAGIGGIRMLWAIATAMNNAIPSAAPSWTAKIGVRTGSRRCGRRETMLVERSCDNFTSGKLFRVEKTVCISSNLARHSSQSIRCASAARRADGSGILSRYSLS